MSSSILDDLTEAQREAVTHMQGPMLVVAGAGSGKTRVVTRRIAYLISQGIHPSHILALTFTNKAADEMKERVVQLVGEAPRWMGTFHAACARFLRIDIASLDDPRDARFTIYDEDDQLSLVKEAIRLAQADEKRFRPPPVLAAISRAKCDGRTPEDWDDPSWYGETLRTIYAEYEKLLRQTNALDFDDLLLLTVRLLEQRPEVRARYQERFRYLLIDEYQDTNRLQYRLMRLLVGPERNIHATGDPDQSIYSWRGADYRNIMDFQKDFPGTRLVRLEKNYRSRQTILHAANHLIRFNRHRIDKELVSDRGMGEKIEIVSLYDDREEGDWVAAKIEGLREKGVALSSIAIFYRTNAQSRPLEEALIRASLPYQIVGGIRFYERKEIKDLLSHLRILVNPRDTTSLRRILSCRPRGVGEKTLEAILVRAEELQIPPFSLLASESLEAEWKGTLPAKLKTFAQWCRELNTVPRAPLSECMEQVLRLSGLVEHYEKKTMLEDPSAADRIENLNQLYSRAVEFADRHPDADLAAFLEDVALVADIDGWNHRKDEVSLMTLHSAKGLEFSYVFLVGLEDGLLPHQNVQTDGGREEERRLFYVGLTRAKEQVFITYVTRRMLWGQLEGALPSPFLYELPRKVIEWIDRPFQEFLREEPEKTAPPIRHAEDRHREALTEAFRKRKEGSKEKFEVGDRIHHPTFGKGIILRLEGEQAIIRFAIGGEKRIHLGVATLVRL